MTSGFRAAWWLALVLVSGLGSLFVGASLVWGAGVSDLVEAHHLQSIDPPRPAADFSLPQFDGAERSLADFRGQWVVLTFWASWCGPCRAEMPSLEALHRSHAGRGVAVLGVSVDQDMAAGEAFIRQHRLTFPQLWDRQSQVGRTFQATAIPMTYLVDPTGHAVAVSRGARDWTELAPLMDSLIALVPPTSSSSVDYAQASDAPVIRNPPTAEVTLSNPAPRAGKEFFLDVHLRWAGHLEEYLPQTPRVHLPEGVTQKGVTASTSSRDGDQVLVYRFTLEAEQDGSFALDPVELRYQPRWTAEVATTQIVGPTVVVGMPTVLGLTPRTLAQVGGGVVATAVAGLVAVWRWKANRDSKQPVSESGFEEKMVRYQEARTLGMQGDGAGSALILIGLLRELRGSTAGEAAAMVQMEERLRFGGEVPTTSELDRMQRDVARQLEALRPNPDQEARGALRLHDEETA